MGNSTECDGCVYHSEVVNLQLAVNKLRAHTTTGWVQRPGVDAYSKYDIEGTVATRRYVSRRVIDGEVLYDWSKIVWDGDPRATKGRAPSLEEAQEASK